MKLSKEECVVGLKWKAKYMIFEDSGAKSQLRLDDTNCHQKKKNFDMYPWTINHAFINHDPPLFAIQQMNLASQTSV